MSIILNVYNGARYVGDCLESILRLEGDAQIQVIVVDDGSTDATAQLLDQYRRMPFQIVRIEPNVGAAAAINYAFEFVRGEFTARIDYDDRYRSNFLIKSLEALRTWPEAAFVCAPVQSIDEWGNPGKMFNPISHGQEPGCRDRFADLLCNNFVTAPTLLARTRHLRNALPIPKGMDFCDWYMNLVMAESAGVAIIEDVTADYRVHSNGMHLTKVRTGMGERVTSEVLDRFLINGPRTKELAPLARTIRGGHKKDWGDKYFAAKMHKDAMRCYRQAFWLMPSLCEDMGMMRRIAGMSLGRGRYEALKMRLKTMRLS